jgi:hypothetical protein
MANKVTVDQDLRSKLNGLHEQIELCDEAGQTIGYFLPDGVYKYLVYEILKLKYPLEELERREKEPGGRTTAEVLATLRQA